MSFNGTSPVVKDSANDALAHAVSLISLKAAGLRLVAYHGMIWRGQEQRVRK